jgi:hypothetical protein
MQQGHLFRGGVLALLGIGFSACTTGGELVLPTTTSTPYPPPGFTHRQSSIAVELFWNCTRPAPDKLLLQGIAANPAQSEVRSLEFILVGVDARGREVSEARDAGPGFILATMQSAPIRLELRTTGKEIRFDLFYQYQSSDQGGNDMTGLRGEGSPVRRVSDSPFLFVQATTRLMVRDACSDTLHSTH